MKRNVIQFAIEAVLILTIGLVGLLAGCQGESPIAAPKVEVETAALVGYDPNGVGCFVWIWSAHANYGMGGYVKQRIECEPDGRGGYRNEGNKIAVPDSN